ncbi:unnamed protein product [Brachionus calyciflorus]|uniref:Uncharacterized protein n=1 Tax=Brachionus calyciflorus TaxID=104777 RepID=A0A813TGD5_9BILA|nr:unnamed protein product [Brachionus calyciflorus]
MQNTDKTTDDGITLRTRKSFDFLVDDLDEDTYLIKEDLKFNVKPRVSSLNDLTLNESNILQNNTINEKNSTKKIFGKSSIKKQLQFKILSEPIRENLEPRTSLSKSTGNLHEQLNKLKHDELQKRRMSSTQSLKSNSNYSSFCLSFDEFKKNLNSFKSSVYKVLERPSGLKGLVYRLFIFTLILGSILTGALTTVKSLDQWSFKLLLTYEIFVTCYFSLEFFLRLWCVGQRSAFKGFNGRIRFILRPLQLIEMTLIIISVIILATGSLIEEKNKEVLFQTTALSALRFSQIFRFLYIDRQAQTWIILSKVIKKHRFELLSCIYIGVIILLFSSYLVLYFEKPLSEKDGYFHTYADAMYWSIITMATIGYGDRSPRTFGGKIVSTTLCIVGVAFWTLPGGIIGSGFALKVEQKNKKKQFNRLLPAAATLIQSWWRMKATLSMSSSNVSCLVATVATFDISKPIYSTSLRRLKRHLDSVNSANEEMNSYFVGLDSPKDTLLSSKENKPDRNLEKNQIYNQKDFVFIDSSDEMEAKNEVNELKKMNSPTRPLYNQLSSESNYSNDESILMKLSPEHLIIIRTILLLKFFRAQKKFKLAFKPYDFKDVIEQYTQGNMDILLKMKDLQRKIDQMNASNRVLNNELIINNSPSSEFKFIQPNFLSASLKSPQTEVTRSSLGRKEMKRLLSLSHDTPTRDKPSNVNQNDINSINQRMERIEIGLEDLAQKINKLLSTKS